MSSAREGSLLSTIEAALRQEPPCVASSGSLRLHALFSIPRQVKTLYPLAHIHPLDLDKCRQRAPITAYLEQIFVTASWTADDDSQSPKSPILILALELYLYTLPAYGSAVLYISKLDSSGYGPASIPSAVRGPLSRSVFGETSTQTFGNTLTATIASAATRHFTTFRHWNASAEHDSAPHIDVNHVAVHILARSQQAYLFPSSPENKNKKVLSDGGLIKWWRDVMSHVIVHSRERAQEQETDTRAFYVIPGYSKLESHPLVPLVSPHNDPTFPRHQLLQSSNWVYGHPYSPAGADCSPDDLPPLPLHWKTSAFVQPSAPAVQTDATAPDYDPATVRTVPTLMPHFSDDPKTRFLDETARDAHEHAGWKRKPVEHTHSEQDAKHSKAESNEVSVPPANKITAQASSTVGNGGAGGVPLVAIRASMRERASLDDLPVDEFWERMGFRQECCSGNAVGVIVCLFTRRPAQLDHTEESSASVGMERQPFSIPHKVLSDLVFHRLMRDVCEWNKELNAVELTRSWFVGVDREIRRKGGVTQSDSARDAADAEETFIGKGQLWLDVALIGPSRAMLDQAKEQTTTAAGQSTNGTSAAPNNTGANVLSVKRKKKPPT